MCGELIGVGQNRPAQRPPLPLTFCGERFATTQTLTFAVIVPRTVTFRRSSLFVGCSKATSSYKTYFILSKVCFSQPLMCLDFHDYPRNENRREKVTINKNSNAADDRQLAADKVRPISIEFPTSFANAFWVKERISLSKCKHKRSAIQEHFNESCM